MILLEMEFKETKDVKAAIDSKANLGVKVDDSFKNNAGINFELYFKKAEEKGLKKPSVGIPYLLSHTNIFNYQEAMNHPALYDYIEAIGKPWVKEMKSFAGMSGKYSKAAWDAFAAEYEKEAPKHGKNANNVKPAFSANGWTLYIPRNFKENLLVSKDNKGNSGWCTRNPERYEHYTLNGKNHLYIIRNFTTGEAYQIAFMPDSVEIFSSENGEEHAYSSGHGTESKLLKELINKLPEGLLALVKDENEKKGRTLLDFKKNVYKEKKYREIGQPIHVEGDVYKVRIETDEYDDKQASSYFAKKSVSTFFNY